MFTAWKKAKAVAGAKAVIRSLFYQSSFGEGAVVPDQLWADPYFLGFFHNIVHYWSRLQFQREALHEFSEIFMRSIYEALPPGKKSECGLAASPR